MSFVYKKRLGIKTVLFFGGRIFGGAFFVFSPRGTGVGVCLYQRYAPLLEKED